MKKNLIILISLTFLMAIFFTNFVKSDTWIVAPGSPAGSHCSLSNDAGYSQAGTSSWNSNHGNWECIFGIEQNVDATPTRSSSTTGTKATTTSGGRTSTTKTSSIPSTSSARGPAGRGWAKTISANNEECWIKSASSGRTSLFRGKFLGKLFE